MKNILQKYIGKDLYIVYEDFSHRGNTGDNPSVYGKLLTVDDDFIEIQIKIKDRRKKDLEPTNNVGCYSIKHMICFTEYIPERQQIKL